MTSEKGSGRQRSTDPDPLDWAPVSDFFYELTPDRVLHAVEAGGFLPTGHCTPLTCLENRVYDLRLEDESHVVVKFYRPGRWSREAILDEHRFLGELREAEIPVCAPVAFSDGGTLREIEGIHYAIWPRTGGRAPDELSDEQVAVLGRLLARIHNVGATSDAPHRARLDAPTSAEAPLAFLEDAGFLPASCARRYRDAVEEAAGLYAEWSADVPVHRIHGDCHAGNLLDGREGWFFLDFDDFVVGPAVHDVWMLLPGRDHEGERQRALFVEAYRQFRDFDTAWLRLVEPLRAFRYVFYAAWIARRWEDAAFPAAFPHFGTPDYWENETRDLELQVARCRDGGPEGAAAGSQERELTNEDFFWDL